MESTIFSIEDRYLVPSYAKFPISIEKGEGEYVWDETGKKFLDLYGGHAVALVGHCHPKLVGTLNEQASKLIFYSSVSYSSVRAKAAKDLIDFVDRDMQIFFSNSGAEANENAIKISQIVTNRPGIVSFEGSFHGRTQGALSVTGITKYRRESSPYVRFAKFNDLNDLKKTLDSSIAAVIFEPIQSLSGVRSFSKEYFHEAFQLCKKAGALVIFDEIQTGLGRTGAPFYFHRQEVEPDLVTVAKGLAGGFPIGATLANRELVNHLKIGDLGSTFGGGPLASVLASQTLSILKDEKLIQNANVQFDHLKTELKNVSGVLEVRGEGLLIGIKTRKPGNELVKEFLKRGILIGSSLDPEVIRLLPPLNVSRSGIQTFVQTLREVL